jgi:hypothetical protein
MPYKEFDVSGIGKIKIYKRKSNQSLRLTVAADGAVRLTMPLWMPYRVGLAFTSTKLEWITSQSSLRKRPSYYNGMKVGKSHHLILQRGQTTVPVKTTVQQTTITVTYGIDTNPEDELVQAAIQTVCLRALRRQATSLLYQRLNQLSLTHGLVYSSIAVKRMKGRWGSCDQNKNIVFNLYLVQLPWEFIDYVILHELTHTKVLHHGADFWSELEKVEPKARQLRKAIKLYHPALYVA